MELFQKFLNQVRQKYKEVDKTTGGWLPGGGVASPLTRARQEGERKMAERIAAQQRPQYSGQPGRFAGQGQLLNAVRATTEAGSNPFAILMGNPGEVKRVADYYQQNPNLQNQYDLNTNMFLRYLSGTGAKGLQVTPEVGKQLYKDIQTQEQKFQIPDNRERMINANPWTKQSWTKQNFLKGRTPVYYGGHSEATTENSPEVGSGLRPTLSYDKGQRWQLRNSLGSFWAEPTNNGYAVNNERYNFMYAPAEKEGTNVPPLLGENLFKPKSQVPNSIADVGRNLVRAGYGTPYTINLQVNPEGQVIFR
jgi:hypothetical protein